MDYLFKPYEEIVYRGYNWKERISTMANIFIEDKNGNLLEGKHIICKLFNPGEHHRNVLL